MPMVIEVVSLGTGPPLGMWMTPWAALTAFTIGRCASLCCGGTFGGAATKDSNKVARTVWHTCQVTVIVDGKDLL